MYKWICLIVAVVFLSSIVWLVNDVRLQVRQTAETVKQAIQDVRQTSDVIKKSGESVNEHLPTIVEKAEKTSGTLADLSDDIHQLKELLGAASTPRDRNLVAYADSILDAIQSSGGMIGVTKTFGSGLKNTLPAEEWVASARKEAVFLTVVAKSKTELLTRLVETKFGSAWHIQLENQEPESLLEWLKKNHTATSELK